MAHQIFTEAWLHLTGEERKKMLAQNMGGLIPAVIYLDDEPGCLDIFSIRCEELGIEAKVSTDPAELLKFITDNRNRIIMIVSDYQMPSGNGFEFREKVSAISSEIPFFILSAHVDRDLALEGVRLQITGFLEKPANKSVLLERLRNEGEARAVSCRDDYEMLKSFTDDVVNIVAELEECCMHLENDPRDTETVSRIFGLVHTVKGSSGFFSPRNLHLFAHSFEEILKQVQKGELAVTTPLISSWLKACDVIKELNADFLKEVHVERDVEKLKEILKIKPEGTPTNEPSVALAEGEAPKAAEHASNRPNDVKVPMSVLDEFTRVSGELTVIRNMVNKVVVTIEKQYPADKDVQVLSELLDEMHKINADIQTKVTDIRRVPASQLVKPLSRNLRDTSKALGKEMDFVVVGEDLRLDNAIATTLSRCLVHLMRNSLDHGLESNEERKTLGKPPRGKLCLKFEAMNEAVLVTLEDDGRGINTSKIRQKVLDQGLRTPEAISAMTEEELHLMIFEAGFSTAAQVTEFSGRGVGMSMVKETITQSNGTIRIQSELGKGCRILLELPVPKSVLIINCLFVTAGDMAFGIPQEHILKALTLEEGHINEMEGSRFIQFEQQLIPVVSLASALNLPCTGKESLLIVLESQGQVFALEVDEVQDTEDAVIKKIQSLHSLGVYQGATFLNDGTVGLILNVPGLAHKMTFTKRTKVPPSKVVVEEKLENLLTFKLNHVGSFAIHEREIFRIEMLSTAKGVPCKGGWMIPYRESTITLVQPEEFLFAQPRSKAGERNDVPTLVIKRGQYYLGFMVNEVIDLEPVCVKLGHSLGKQRGIRGGVLHRDLVLTLLDLEELCALFGVAPGREPKALTLEAA